MFHTFCFVACLVYGGIFKGAVGRLWYDGECGSSKYADAGSLPSVNIVGGVEARENEFPYQASLNRRRGGRISQSCGASIINNEWVITAAHCLAHNQPYEDYRVVVGEHIQSEASTVEVTYDVALYVMHESYDGGAAADYDIALVKLNGTIDFTENIQPVCEPEPFSDFGEFVGETSIVSGWGITEFGSSSSADRLLYVAMSVMDNGECKDILREFFYRRHPTDVEICAGDAPYTETDSCTGDSGGPMTVRREDEFILVGVTSHGMGCASGAPGVYVRVSQFVQWVADTMDANQ